jgi:signal transduction histidine kinase
MAQPDLGKLPRTKRPRARRGGPPRGETSQSLATRLAQVQAELDFLQEITQLAAGAATWDELMQLIVDRSTSAMRAEVCSLYLVDRDGQGLTLAATNGVDKQHVGVARLRIGEGITGLAAEERQPIVSVDLRDDPRCAWIRGVDHARFISMVAVPLQVRDRVVGALNVKTTERREFSGEETRRLATIAALLAGVVERRRLQLAAETQLDSLRSIDHARAELVAVVTHQLRTPLAIVRAYLELLAERAVSDGAGDDGSLTAGRDSREPGSWHRAAAEQLTRLDGLVGTILDTVRADRMLSLEQRAFEIGPVVDEVLFRVAPLLRRHRLERYENGGRYWAVGDPARLGQVLELLLENAAKYAPDGASVVVADWTDGAETRVCVGDSGPGIPEADRERVFEPFVRLGSREMPGSGVGLFAARRLVAAMGGRLWIEDRPGGGSQFVAALPRAEPAAPA